MYVLLRGRVEVAIEHEGSRLVVDHGGPGDIFGEVGFAGPGVPRTASIRAVTPVTAVKLDAARAHRGLRLYPRIATLVFRNISRLLGERLQASHARLLRAAGGE
jgi:CRP-like cAMP-binding protein